MLAHATGFYNQGGPQFFSIVDGVKLGVRYLANFLAVRPITEDFSQSLNGRASRRMLFACRCVRNIVQQLTDDIFTRNSEPLVVPYRKKGLWGSSYLRFTKLPNPSRF